MTKTASVIGRRPDATRRNRTRSRPGLERHPHGTGENRTRSRAGLERRRARFAYLLLVPAFLVFIVFQAYPVIESVRVSFFDYTPFTQKFIGLDNYARMLTDSRVWGATMHTLLYAGVTTVVTVLLALTIALVLDAKLPLRTATRTIVFLPFVVSMAVVSVSFAFLLDPDLGWLATMLQNLGLPSVAILRDPTLAMIAVMAIGVWKFVGYYAIILLAGLQSVPHDVLEAARVDGASTFREIVNIKVPLLMNSTMIVSVLALISGLQVFDQVYVMTNGGPYHSTETIVGLIFEKGFNDLEMGYASAIAVVFTLFVAGASFIQMRFFSSRLVRN